MNNEKINELINRVNEISEMLNDTHENEYWFKAWKPIEKVDTAGAERILQQLEELTK